MSSNQKHLFPIEQVKNRKHKNRKDHNQYFTPEIAVEKALALVPMANVANIIDPAVGDGVFLKVAFKKCKLTLLTALVRLIAIDMSRL